MEVWPVSETLLKAPEYSVLLSTIGFYRRANPLAARPKKGRSRQGAILYHAVLPDFISRSVTAKCIGFVAHTSEDGVSVRGERSRGRLAPLGEVVQRKVQVMTTANLTKSWPGAITNPPGGVFEPARSYSHAARSMVRHAGVSVSNALP